MKHSIFLLGWLFPVVGLTQLTGRVVNSNNEGISNANVSIKSSSIGTTTDAMGYFSLTHKQKYPFTLTFSYTGFQTEERIIRNNNVNKLDIELRVLYQYDTLIVTSRRRREKLQDIPIPISVITAAQVNEAGAFNVNRVKEFVPSLQLYTSNPRNTGISIRGLGSPFGLTNDGLDPGVGFYVDGVYYARPAAATLDFIDIERMEVLRGPQGTLFGKNSTSGAINITTRRPDFKPGGNFEVSYGNFGYIQAKSSLTGPIGKKIAARISFSGTQRDGILQNIRTGSATNEINNLGLHGQFLFKLSENTSILLSADNTKQRPDGYAQVIAGVVPTQRPAYRQFNAIISDLNYSLPSMNAFDRLIDHDTPWRSDNDMGGISINTDTRLGPGIVTSSTAWRYWNWNPSNDRDFTGLQALAKSQNPSKHQQWSQEFRYAGKISPRLTGVLGLFVLGQEVMTTGDEQSGKDQWRFVQNSTSSLWKTPGLLDGYGAKTNSSIKSLSTAVFTNIDWEITKDLHLLPGLRFNYDKKEVSYDRITYGGLQTTDPLLVALQQIAYTPQTFVANADEKNLTYQLTLAFRANKQLNTFATYSTSYKPVGVNVAGLPMVNGAPATDLAVISPEYVKHVEIGIKTTPVENSILNLTLYHTHIKDYQANVQSPQLGVNRGYIANAGKVSVKGVELDASYKASRHFSFYGNLAFTEAKYIQFTNAPLPLEETGLSENGVQKYFKDISGSVLPGISKWAGSVGGEFSVPAIFVGKAGKFFFALDSYYRSAFSSSSSASLYLNVEGYTLLNGRIGFKSANLFSMYIWGRNLLNKDYYEQLLVAGGNTGQFAGVLGDPGTYGITMRYSF